ncbi:hypothetical protein EGT07_25140 [Herbaspirillum sp. HC18]|nr:hypothetical protein EGT07_25140 [Herbaspirillum sp. HC18]
MKKLPPWVGMAVGALIGLFTSIPDSVGLKIVMMSIGALAGTAVGAAISRIGERNHKMRLQQDSIPGVGFSPEERMRTYWRDKGKIYPMSGHPDPEGATRDPDQLF